MKAALLLCLMMTISAQVRGATYEVPVEENLKPFATFELNEFQKTTDGHNVSVKYVLPEILTGSNTTIEMAGTVDEGTEHFSLTGVQGKADCEGLEKTVCTVTYSGLFVDTENATLAIKKISKTKEEFGMRLEVMRNFSTDPIGSIYY
jgi:hypothetical protein